MNIVEISKKEDPKIYPSIALRLAKEGAVRKTFQLRDHEGSKVKIKGELKSAAEGDTKVFVNVSKRG